MTESQWIDAAVTLAREALHDDVGGPFGAVVVRDDRIVGHGRNRVIAARDPTAHAEVEAVRDACRRLGSHELEGCTLYTSSEPCPMCLGALYWARVDRVVYAVDRAGARRAGFADAYIYEEFAKPPEARRLQLVHHQDEEAESVMRRWAAREDRTLY